MARPAASDVSFTILGLISFQADLMPLTESTTKETGFKMVCPTCTDATKLDQQYHCPGGHGPFTTADAGRAKEVAKGQLVKVTADEIAAVKEPTLPAKEMTVTAFPAAQVQAATRPSGLAYRIKADKNLAVISMITELVAGGEYAFIGELNLGRSGQKLYGLATWKGTLVVEELARPDEVLEFAPTAVEYDTRVLEQARQLASIQVADFDPVAFRSIAKERALALNEALLSGAPAPVAVAPVAKKDTTVDLLAALEASIAAAKAA